MGHKYSLMANIWQQGLLRTYEYILLSSVLSTISWDTKPHLLDLWILREGLYASVERLQALSTWPLSLDFKIPSHKFWLQLELVKRKMS